MHLNINGFEYELDIDYEYHRAEYGARDGGVPIEPDIPAHVEIKGVKMSYGDKDWREIDLPYDVLEELERELLGEYQ